MDAPATVTLGDAPSCHQNEEKKILGKIQNTLVNYDNKSQITHKTPIQDVTRSRISELEGQVNALLTVQNSGLGTSENEKKLKKLQTLLNDEKKKLKMKMDDAERQKKSRERKKQKMSELCEKIPEAAEIVQIRSTPCRPRLEVDQPDLLKIIVDLATHGSAADDRRRSEVIRDCRTLDELHEKLKLHGLELSRSALYLRLIPRRANSNEGKKHMQTVPVKLIKAQTSEHKLHVDT